MEPKKIMPKNKRGQIGLDLVKNVIVAFLILSVIGIATFLALVSLRDAGIFTANTVEERNTNDTILNITSAVTDFFSNTGTIFSILVVVVIILAIAIVIGVVTRFGGAGRTGRTL